MNNEIITAVIGVFFIILLFIFITNAHLINRIMDRVSLFGFSHLGKHPAKPKTITLGSIPWTWHKAWVTSLLHPNAETSEALITEGNITFSQAYIWIVITSFVVWLLNSLIFSRTVPNYDDSIWGFLKGGFFAVFISPIIYLVFSGLIHLLAKLFGSRATFQKFFIVFVSFYLPVSILIFPINLIRVIFKDRITLLLGMILSFYLVFFVIPKAIKSYYHFSRLKAFFIYLIVTLVISFFVIALFLMSTLIL